MAELFGLDMLSEEQKQALAQQAEDDRRPDPVPPADFGIPEPEVGTRPGKGAFDPDETMDEAKSKKRPRGRPALPGGDPSKRVSVKGIPKRMLSIARQSFDSDVTQTDAFIAYLVCNCPEFAADRDLRSLGLTDRQKELVEACDTNSQASMIERMKAMSRKLDICNRQVSILNGIVSLLLYDYSGNKITNEKLTSDRIRDQDFMVYDSARFSEFQDALFTAFKRFSGSVAEHEGIFFN